jgi:hypothetical protein
MDQEKFEKMAEMMRRCCEREDGLMDCLAMMKKMVRYGKEAETEEKKKDTGEKE